MAVSDWSTNADLNTSIDDIDISEHCPAKNMNDALRHVMSNVKEADSNVVHATGDETIAGTKTFSSTIVGSVSGDASTTKTWSQKNLPPIGTVIHFAGSSAPTGFIVANGAAVSRTTYVDLFAVIGTTYGTGDGSTTFNLPNLIDRFIQGNATVGTVKTAGLPNITGSIGGTSRVDAIQETSGALRWNRTDYPVYQVNAAGTASRDFNFDASRCSSIYGNSTTVQPPALTLLPCIKY